jgi:hypothetical protein
MSLIMCTMHRSYGHKLRVILHDNLAVAAKAAFADHGVSRTI